MNHLSYPHPIKIGHTILPHGLLLAPMAGVTDAAFRKICVSHGAEWTVTEMISAKAMWYHDHKTASLARVEGDEMPAAVQIFGAEPEVMAYAAKVLSSPDTPVGRLPAAIDINMGCPMPKIVNNGDGSALMKDPTLAGHVIEAVRAATDLPVTVKIRTGWDAAHKNCVEIARIAASLGVAMIAVHGRTRTQLYAPPCDLDAIRAVREAVSAEIPVIGNGDIGCAADALHMMEVTGCDGVMIGRGACGNPWIFEEIVAVCAGRAFDKPTQAARIAAAMAHLDLLVEKKGEVVGMREARKHLAWYIKGVRGAAALRDAIMKTEEPETVRALLAGAMEA